MNSKPIVYFISAIRGVRKRKENVISLIQWLKELGVTILTEHVGANDPIEAQEKLFGKTKGSLTAEDIEKRDIAWLNQAEYVIAEISGASTGAGREIEYARTKEHFGHKAAQILCLYHQEDEFFASPMVRGMTKDRYKNVTITAYQDIEQAKGIIKKFLELE
ncbi:MAG: hypothetical protein ABH889_00665 [Candidatus Portnoybacteria bacterium]